MEGREYLPPVRHLDRGGVLGDPKELRDGTGGGTEGRLCSILPGGAAGGATLGGNAGGGYAGGPPTGVTLPGSGLGGADSCDGLPADGIGIVCG